MVSPKPLDQAIRWGLYGTGIGVAGYTGYTIWQAERSEP